LGAKLQRIFGIRKKKDKKMHQLLQIPKKSSTFAAKNDSKAILSPLIPFADAEFGDVNLLMLN